MMTEEEIKEKISFHEMWAEKEWRLYEMYQQPPTCGESEHYYRYLEHQHYAEILREILQK